MTYPNERTGPLQGSGSNEIGSVDDYKRIVSQSRRRRDATDNLGYVEHFRARVLQDALTEGLRSTWLRRADEFEAAMHKPGDFAGLCSVDRTEANNRRLAAKAQACRNHASICIFQDRNAICEHLQVAV